MSRRQRRHHDWHRAVTSAKLRHLLGLGPLRQTWCRPAGSAWKTECQRCGRLGRMVRVRWLLVLERDQCARGQGCQGRHKAAPVAARTPRPRQVSSRQVAAGLAHERLDRQRAAQRRRGDVVVCDSFQDAVSGHPFRTRVLPHPGATQAEIDALVRVGQKMAQGLDRRTRRRMGL